MAKKSSYENVLLCGDVGGTKVRLAVVGMSPKKHAILLYHEEPTKNITDFVSFLHHAYHYAIIEQGFDATGAVFSVAGPINNQKVQLTNAPLALDASHLTKKTPLHHVLLVNDFTAAAYGTTAAKASDVHVLNRGRAVKGAPRIVLGAGTGLGKAILVTDQHKGATVVASEGGHGDLPLLSEQEHVLARFVEQRRKVSRLQYEDLLSGRGLEDIYKYYQTTRYARQPPNLSAEAISRSRKSNPCSKKTFHTFVTIYARCARNFFLDAFARGGVFITGGIAAKNHDMFNRFMTPFIDNRSYATALKTVPVKIIKNERLALLGAAVAYQRYQTERAFSHPPFKK